MYTNVKNIGLNWLIAQMSVKVARLDYVKLKSRFWKKNELVCKDEPIKLDTDIWPYLFWIT